jgi:hypothetical protein
VWPDLHLLVDSSANQKKFVATSPCSLSSLSLHGCYRHSSNRQQSSSGDEKCILFTIMINRRLGRATVRLREKRRAMYEVSSELTIGEIGLSSIFDMRRMIGRVIAWQQAEHLD